MFDTTGLALLNHTSNITENSSIDQHQPLIMVQVKLTVHKSYKCIALIDSGASFSFMSQ